jgi:hypothetical protein
MIILNVILLYVILVASLVIVDSVYAELDGNSHLTKEYVFLNVVFNVKNVFY